MEVSGVPGHKIERSDFVLAKTIADTLESHYPGWGWMVNIDSEKTTGMVYITNAILAGALQRAYGWRLHFNKLSNHRFTVRRAITAGGELLERMGCSRGPYKGQKITHVQGAAPADQPLRFIIKSARG